MLALTRYANESVVLKVKGEYIRVLVHKVQYRKDGSRVVLAIDAPVETVEIWRDEILPAAERQALEASR